MGRSLPSFASTDCAITTYDPELATLAAVQLDQQETIRAGAKVFKDRSLGCWNRPEFKLTVKKQGVKKKRIISWSTVVLDSLLRISSVLGSCLVRISYQFMV